MRRTALTAFVSLLTLASCTRRGPAAAEQTLTALRAAAAGSNATPQAQRDRAFAELLAPGGDVAVGERLLTALRVPLNEDLRVRFLYGALQWQRGNFSEAAEHFASVLRLAANSRDPMAGIAAEASTNRLINMRGDFGRFPDVFRPLVEQVARDPGHLPPAATFNLLDTGIRWARERGDVDAVGRWTRAAGCATHWTVAGPFGPYPMLRFDETLPPEEGALAAAYELGANRGARATYEINARGCAANLGRGRSETGVFVAATDFTVQADGTYWLRVESPNPFQARVDGVLAATSDPRRGPEDAMVLVPVTLRAGRHSLRVKIASRFSSPLLVTALLDASSRPVATWVPPRGAANPIPPLVDAPARWPVPQDPFERYLLGDLALARRNGVRAREALRPLAPAEGIAPLVAVSWGQSALADTYLATNVARDRARRAFESARRADPRAWFPVVTLARLAAADERGEEALRLLREANTSFAGNPEVLAEYSTRLVERGWDPLARSLLEQAAQALPGVCWPIRGLLGLAQRTGDGREEMARAEEVRRCDAMSESVAQVAMRARRWDLARTEYQRLLSLDPDGRALRRTLVDLSRQSGALEDARRGFDAHLLAEHPEDSALRADVADLLLASNARPEALQLLDDEFARAPAAMGELARLSSVLRGRPELAAWRQDGVRILRDFQQAGRRYDGAAVLVLDYTVRRVYSDGSALELTHNIVRVQSQEAVDEHATFNPPQGARLLRARTHKADGRLLEPEDIAQLDAVAFPDVHPGDAVEFEYVRVLPARDLAAGGFLGDRFYFRGADIPYDRSELVIVVPRAMAANVVVDPRGDAPQTQRTELADALVELRWSVRNSQRFTPEPNAVSAREFIPSVGVGAGATWERYGNQIRDRLADLDPVDPEVQRFVAEHLRGARNDDERLERLHRWVLLNIEQGEGSSPFASAPRIMSARSGHRGRALCYLLRIGEVPCSLAVVRAAGGDRTEGVLPDDESYPGVLLRVGSGTNVRWVSTEDRGAAVDYIPPIFAGQQALVLTNGSPRLQVNVYNPEQHQRSMQVRLTIDAQGNGRAEVTEHMRGIHAVNWRESIRGIDPANLEREFEGFLGQRVTAASLQQLRVEGLDDPSRELVLHYTFTAPGVATAAGRGRSYRFEGILPEDLTSTYAQLPARATALFNRDARETMFTMEVVLPSGARVASLPENNQGSATGVRWSVRRERTDNGFRIQREVHIPPGRVEPADYEAFAEEVRAVDTEVSQRITFEMP